MGKARGPPKWLIGYLLLAIGTIVVLFLRSDPSAASLLSVNGIIYLVASGLFVLSLAMRGDPWLTPEATILVAGTLSAQLLSWMLLPSGPASRATSIALLLSSILPWAFLSPAILRRDQDAWLAGGMLGTVFFGTILVVFRPLFEEPRMLILVLTFLGISLLSLYAAYAEIKNRLRRRAARQGGGHGVKGGYG